MTSRANRSFPYSANDLDLGQQALGVVAPDPERSERRAKRSSTSRESVFYTGRDLGICGSLYNPVLFENMQLLS